VSFILQSVTKFSRHTCNKRGQQQQQKQQNNKPTKQQPQQQHYIFRI